MNTDTAVTWPKWVEPTKARVLQFLRDRAAERVDSFFFTQQTVRGFLRSSGKAGVSEFIFVQLEKDGSIERVSKEVPFGAALWRLR